MTSLRPAGARKQRRYSMECGTCWTFGEVHANLPVGAPIWWKLAWTRPVTGLISLRMFSP